MASFLKSISTLSTVAKNILKYSIEVWRCRTCDYADVYSSFWIPVAPFLLCFSTFLVKSDISKYLCWETRICRCFTNVEEIFTNLENIARAACVFLKHHVANTLWQRFFWRKSTVYSLSDLNTTLNFIFWWHDRNMPLNYLLACNNSFLKNSKDMIIWLFANNGYRWCSFKNKLLINLWTHLSIKNWGK